MIWVHFAVAPGGKPRRRKVAHTRGDNTMGAHTLEGVGSRHSRILDALHFNDERRDWGKDRRVHQLVAFQTNKVKG